MPRWARMILTTSAFSMFFLSTLILGLLAAPILMLRKSGGDKRSFTRKLHHNMQMFTGFMRDVALIDYWPPELPDELEGRAFLLIANHPTLIDAVLSVVAFPQISCVAKAGWYKSWIMGPMLRRLTYVPGPGFEGDDEADGTQHPMVERLQTQLEEGIPVLVFPEGTRSAANKLRKFGRGAIEAAIRAEVPILPMFISVDRPLLMKGQPFYDVPDRTALYQFEYFDIIETAGKGLDSKALTRDLSARYNARWSRLVEERDTNLPAR